MRRVAWILAACAWAPAAQAGTASTSMAVTASVSAACSVAASPLVFGSYNGRQLDATAAIAATCSGGTAYDIAVDSGTGPGASPAQRQLAGIGDDVRSSLSYAIYADTAHSALWGSSTGIDTVAGIGTGSVQSIPVYGRIAANQSPGRGIYQDAVQVTISF